MRISLSISRAVFYNTDAVFRKKMQKLKTYWRDLESIRNWKENTDHAIAREKGKTTQYQSFKVRVAKVERDYQFEKQKNNYTAISHALAFFK